jgi:hypothetical protein
LMRTFCPAGCALAVVVNPENGNKAEAAAAPFNSDRRSTSIKSSPTVFCRLSQLR